MSVLLTNTYFYLLDPKQWKAGQPYPPLNTIYAASWLRENGFKVTFFDNCLQPDTSALTEQLSKEIPKYFVVFDDGFNYLTKMCLTVMREAAMSMMSAAKNLGCTTIIYSSDATDHAEEYHQSGVDFVIHGEGEITLLDLLQALEGGLPVNNVDGISYSDKSCHKTNKRLVLQNLDLLPMPAWDLIDIAAYRTIWMKKHGYFSLNIATTRGCPFKCNWCAKPMYGNRYNTRTPAKVLEEISYLIDNHELNHFWMCDDIFGLKPNWVQEFNDLIQEKKLSFKYKIQSRVDLLLAENNIDVLVASGLETAWVGAESGSQRILDAMDKGTTVEQIHKAAGLLKQKGVRVAFFLQFGYLNETIGDIKKTIKMVLDIVPDELGISISYPLPGTRFYEIVKNQLQTKANWVDSSDLDLMFENTYSPQFYRILHQLVHSKHRAKRGVESLKMLTGNPLKLSYATLRSIVSGLYHFLKTLMLEPSLTKLTNAHG